MHSACWLAVVSDINLRSTSVVIMSPKCDHVLSVKLAGPRCLQSDLAVPCSRVHAGSHPVMSLPPWAGVSRESPVTEALGLQRSAGSSGPIGRGESRSIYLQFMPCHRTLRPQLSSITPAYRPRVPAAGAALKQVGVARGASFDTRHWGAFKPTATDSHRQHPHRH